MFDDYLFLIKLWLERHRSPIISGDEEPEEMIQPGYICIKGFCGNPAFLQFTEVIFNLFCRTACGILTLFR